METEHGKHPQIVENDKRDADAQALEHFDRNIGMNYDAGFGSLLEDSAAADIARTRRDNAIVEE